MSKKLILTADLIRTQLRLMRGNAGLSQDEYGKLAHFSASMVSAVELGQRPLDADYLARADKIFKTGNLFVSLLLLAERDGEPIWFRPWLDAERVAKQLRCFEPNLIPGLLQTPAYARAILRGDDTLTEDEVEQLVTARMTRQAILTQERPPQLVAVIEENALRRFVNGYEKIMAEQLLHLVTLAERPHVHVHVVPASVGLHLGLSGPFVLARSTDGGWVGHLENQLGGTVVDRTEDVEILLARWESVRNVALPTGQSLDLIKEIAQPWI
ncbi:Scr1 family TA system antitoxin-like transcriptional regulator [Plantactinospora veratri]|uniref:Scr1 family TA system antitoxin-like transcriptional regulator n=1 Tax=Plantactinospora veratri TaxID=1436122 RepID=A0ABU7S9U3_9ACTN